VFDLLVDEKGASLVALPLEGPPEAPRDVCREGSPESPAHPRVSGGGRSQVAIRWYERTGGALDGVIAKRRDLPTLGGPDRDAKIKQRRTADCVVGGFRFASKGHVIGLAPTGASTTEGWVAAHVGFTSGISNEEKKALVPKLEKLIRPPGFTGHAPGGPSRWSTERSGEWKPLQPSWSWRWNMIT